MTAEEAGRKGSSKEKGSSKRAKSTPKRKLTAKGEGQECQEREGVQERGTYTCVTTAVNKCNRWARGLNPSLWPPLYFLCVCSLCGFCRVWSYRQLRSSFVPSVGDFLGVVRAVCDFWGRSAAWHSVCVCDAGGELLHPRGTAETTLGVLIINSFFCQRGAKIFARGDGCMSLKNRDRPVLALKRLVPEYVLLIRNT